MELRLMTPLFQFYFRADLRLLIFCVSYNFGRHPGHALFFS